MASCPKDRLVCEVAMSHFLTSCVPSTCRVAKRVLRISYYLTELMSTRWYFSPHCNHMLISGQYFLHRPLRFRVFSVDSSSLRPRFLPSTGPSVSSLRWLFPTQ